MIVDDKTNNLQLLSRYLENDNYNILIAQSGKKAIHIAEAISPDLILLDVMMPKINGFKVCRRLKSNSQTKDIPIIFMTALAETKNKVQGLELGAVDYITKPVEKEELIARLNTHLQLRLLNRRLTAKMNEFMSMNEKNQNFVDLSKKYVIPLLQSVAECSSNEQSTIDELRKNAGKALLKLDYLLKDK